MRIAGDNRGIVRSSLQIRDENHTENLVILYCVEFGPPCIALQDSGKNDEFQAIKNRQP